MREYIYLTVAWAAFAAFTIFTFSDESAMAKCMSENNTFDSCFIAINN